MTHNAPSIALVLTFYFYARNEELFMDLPPSSDDRELSPEDSRPKSRIDRPRKHSRRMPSTSSEESDTTRINAGDPRRIKVRTVLPRKSPASHSHPALQGGVSETESTLNAGVSEDAAGIDLTGRRTPSQPVHADIMEGINKLHHIRILTEQWTSGLGPVDQWPRIFQEGYDDACRKPTQRSTQEEVDEFLKGVALHVENGRKILQELRKDPVVKPPSSIEGWGEFLIAGDLMDLLYRGISLLEVRLDILAPSCALPSGEQSAIRKWRGLSDAF